MSLFTRRGAPRLRRFEIAASFVSRLAAWLRYSTASRFCFDFDLNFEALSSGDSKQLRDLAILTETPVEDLAHGPIREGRLFRVDGQLLSTAYLDRIDLWLCPDCAQEDMDAAPHLPAEAAVAVRRDDIVSAIAGCARHRRALVKVGRSTLRHDRHDTSLTTMDVPMRLEELRALSPIEDPSAMDVFVRERFEGKPQRYELLNQMSLNQAIKFSGRFGQWLEQGEVNMRRLDRAELNRLYSTGLKVLAGGRATIADAIEKRSIDEHGRHRHTVMNDIWMLLGENRGDPAIENLRAVVSQAAKDHRAALPFQHRRRRLDLDAEVNLVSIDQAKERYRTGPKAVEAFARAADAITNRNGLLRIDADRLEEWMQRDGGVVPAWKVAADIGATDYQMQVLVEGAILVPTIARSGSKKSYDWFRLRHIEAVMENMVGHAEIADRIPAGMVTMSQMLRRTRGAIGQVHQSLLGRTMPLMRLAGEKPYASILVSMSDVMALMGQDLEDDDAFVTLGEFAAACGFNNTIAYTLAGLEIFKAEMRVSPDTGMRRHMVRRTEIDDFWKKYVSAAQLAAQLGESRANITAKMTRIGVDKVNTGKARITLFLREKVARLLPG